MNKQPAVTLNTCFIKIRQERRDEIAEQTADFIKSGGKVDHKPNSWSYIDERGDQANTFNRTKI